MAALRFSKSALEKLGHAAYASSFLYGPFLKKFANRWSLELEGWVRLGLVKSGTEPSWQDSGS